MKKRFLVVIIVTLLFGFISCSKDDDGDSSGKLDGVPSGEIVAVGLRQQTLTGFDEDGNGTQKWWTHVISSITYSSVDCGDDVAYEDTGYYAWYPDGNYYQKSTTDGTPVLVGEWEWTNSTKTKVYIYNSSSGAEGEMTVTYLNDNNIVYGSQQSASGCSATVFEQFNNPF